jgi:hypothetical protein
MLTLALAPLVALTVAIPQPAGSQPIANQGFRLEAETGNVRVARVVLAPGERVEAESPGGAVMVYLTADLDGRMPPAEAVWQPAGHLALENRGPARFEAVLIEFKTAPSAQAAEAQGPPEHRTLAAWPPYPMLHYSEMTIEGARSQTLVDSPRVHVTRQRYPATSSPEPLRVDGSDTVLVYLRGGYAWPSELPLYEGPLQVHRGDVRILAAGIPYTLSNPSADPSEFVVIEKR